MSVMAIIVTHNSKDVITRCLTSLISTGVTTIIAVDSGSTDATPKILGTFPLKAIPLSGNIGYAAGNNLGIKEALASKSDYFLILNPDVTLNSNTVTNLIKSAHKLHNRGIFGPKIIQKSLIWSAGGELDKNRYTAGLIGYGHKNTGFNLLQEVDFLSGTCILVPRQVVEYGLRFYEPYFLYYEDVEFCVRAKKLGFASYMVPDATIMHTENSERETYKQTKDYYLARNHLLFVERNAPLRVQLRELVRLPKTLLTHYSQKDFYSLRGIIDYATRRFGKFGIDQKSRPQTQGNAHHSS